MLCARDIMTREVRKLTPETTIRDAMELLSINHLSGAPVVAGERVVGVISMTDILGLLISPADPVLTDQVRSSAEDLDETDQYLEDDKIRAAVASDDVWEEWPPGSEGRAENSFPSGDGLLDLRTVEDAMNHEIFSVAPTASVRTVATMMREHGIHRVIVIEKGVLAGIISSLDMARAVSEKGLSGRTGIFREPACNAKASWITR